MIRKLKKYVAVSLLSTIVFTPGFCYIYNEYKWNMIDDNLYGQFTGLSTSITFWLILFLVTFSALLPDLLMCVTESSLRLYQLCKVARREGKRPKHNY